MRELVSFVRFLLVLALSLTTEALAGESPSTLWEVQARLNKGQGAALVDRLEELARQEPDSAVAHHLLGRALYQSAVPTEVGPQEALRLRQRAIEEERAAVLRDPSFVAAWGELSYYLEVNEEYERAAEARLRQVRLEPENEEHRSKYVDLLERAARSEAALQALRTWVSERPKSSTANARLGMRLQMAGKDDEAIAAYRRAVALGEGDQIPIYLGGLLAKQGRWEEAQDAYAHGSHGMEYPLGIYGQGVAFTKLGKVKPARQMLAILVNDEEPEPSLIKRLRAVIQNPKSEPVLGFDALKEP